MPLLSLLIPTLACRTALLARLMDCLTGQLTSDVEVLTQPDDGDETIGAKRNRLLDRAAGDYVGFIDDDDLVSERYVASLLHALRDRPDCVGFKVARFEQMLRSGPTERIGTYYHTLTNARCGDHPLPGDKWRHDRWPGHLQPVRRDLALSVRFPDWSFGEDRDYQHRLRPLLTSEVFVDDELYLYFLRHDDVRQGEKVHPTRWRDDRQVRITKRFTVPANA